mgnify:CR=1 FL=1
MSSYVDKVGISSVSEKRTSWGLAFLGLSMGSTKVSPHVSAARNPPLNAFIGSQIKREATSTEDDTSGADTKSDNVRNATNVLFKSVDRFKARTARRLGRPELRLAHTMA